MYEEAEPTSLEDLLASLREGGRGLPDPAGHEAPTHSHATHDHADHAGHDHDDHDHDGHDSEPGTTTSVREARHDGHLIRIETTYRITVDGQPLEGHLEVLDNGAVHYHGLPNYSLPSAIDMVRLVIDHFGTEPPAVDELSGEHGSH